MGDNLVIQNVKSLKKRDRGKNFSEFEKYVLLDITEKFQSVIETRANDTKTLRLKDEAWKKVTYIFLSHPNVGKRDYKQLKNCYENMKKKVKKDYFEKNEVNKSGSLDQESMLATFKQQLEPSCQQLEPPCVELASEAEYPSHHPTLNMVPLGEPFADTATDTSNGSNRAASLEFVDPPPIPKIELNILDDAASHNQTCNSPLQGLLVEEMFHDRLGQHCLYDNLTENLQPGHQPDKIVIPEITDKVLTVEERQTEKHQMDKKEHEMKLQLMQAQVKEHEMRIELMKAERDFYLQAAERMKINGLNVCLHPGNLTTK